MANGFILRGDLLARLDAARRVFVLTGAGMSAESGIPTFREAQTGIWSRYNPQELATQEAFEADPARVWRWYEHRRTAVREARPHAGHGALVELESLLPKLTIATQNVDGLHLRAGSHPEKTYQIHGNVFFMRCAAECRPDLLALPEDLIGRDKDQPLAAHEKHLLACPACGGRARPHVLWFDEIYNEHHFRFQSALRAARATRLLVERDQ